MTKNWWEPPLFRAISSIHKCRTNVSPFTPLHNHHSSSHPIRWTDWKTVVPSLGCHHLIALNHNSSTMNSTLTLLVIALVIATASAFGVHTPLSGASVSLLRDVFSKASPSFGLEEGGHDSWPIWNVKNGKTKENQTNYSLLTSFHPIEWNRNDYACSWVRPFGKET